jgi:hypothetical protein
MRFNYQYPQNRSKAIIKFIMSAQIVSETQNFNASIVVTDLLMKTLENAAKDLVLKCINEAAIRHGFDAEEELKVLGLESLLLLRKKMAKKTGKSSETKTVREPKAPKKEAFPLPFIPELVCLDKCHGLAYNHGLFTQCAKTFVDEGKFCKSCKAQTEQNPSGEPDCGTVQLRLASDLYEYKDSKGRTPIPYVKVLEKLKLSVDDASGKTNVEIPSCHFTVTTKPKNKDPKEKVARGRPKKISTAVAAENVDDLFEKLTADEDDLSVEEEEEEVKAVKPTKKAKLSDEEKEAKIAKIQEERAIKKLEQEEKAAIEKKEREDRRNIEKQQREEAKAAEKLAAEQAKEALKAEKAALKAAEKKSEKKTKAVAEEPKAVAEEPKAIAEEPKPVAEEPVKAVKVVKKTKEVKAAPIEEPKVVAKEQKKPVSDPAESKVKVSKIQIGGTFYLKTSANILYNLEKEEVGIYDPETKTIKPMPQEDDDEIEEDDYEEEEEEEEEEEA